MQYLIYRFLPNYLKWAKNLSTLDKMKFQLHLIKIVTSLILLFTSASCKKIIQIDPPTSSITTSKVFSDSADANAALMGIYALMINTRNPEFGSGAITLYCGLSADELMSFQSSPDVDQLYLNSLVANNGATYSDIWNTAYPIIYQTNACLEGLQTSSTINKPTKDQFTGEAKFIRAFCYFYLASLFGDLPYVSSSSWASSSLATRVPQAEVYQKVMQDLKDAQKLLPTDYSVSSGERIRANQYAATALLARLYLYSHDYENAAAEATKVIVNTGTYKLVEDLSKVFLANSSEAILQWGLNPPNSSIANLTPEGLAIIAHSATAPPYYYFSQQLLASFEAADQRRIQWVDSTNYAGTLYYYPYKYKLGAAQFAHTSATEYYMVLRLAEQYLIRAEAEANGVAGGLPAAVTDLNVIRNRAGLPNYTGVESKDSVLAAIAHERRIELFAEWGHRWLDLKRTGQVDAVMSLVTPQKNGGSTWNSYQQLYPIPISEINLDPNLTQNPGY